MRRVFVSSNRLDHILKVFEEYSKKGPWQAKLVQKKTRELFDRFERERVARVRRG